MCCHTPRGFPAGNCRSPPKTCMTGTNPRHPAAQAPWWQPGTASGYHAHNQGHLIGEATGASPGVRSRSSVRDEIAGPLRADFQIGAEPEDYDRIAEIIAPPPLELPLDLLPEDSPMRKTFSGPPPNADAANTSRGARPSWAHSTATATRVPW